MFRLTPERLRVFAGVDERANARNNLRLVLGIGDTEPLAGGFEDAHVGFTGGDEGIDLSGHVALGFELGAALGEEGGKGCAQMREDVRGEAEEVHRYDFVSGERDVSALGIHVVNMADAKLQHQTSMGCGCATMSRNDPPHLVALIDLLRQGKTMDYHTVKPGDQVNEFTGTRQRLIVDEQQWIVQNAKQALRRMIEITEKM